jgi:hypothetical protein
MTDRTQFEHMLEALINEDQQTAKDIFHNIVVAKSREIYEELLENDFGRKEDDDRETDESAEDDSADDSADDAFSDKDSTDDMMNDVDADSDDMDADNSDEDVEDRVQDLEDALEDLKAEFEQLMAGEEGEEHMGGDDMGSDNMPADDMAGDEFGAEPGVEDESYDMPMDMESGNNMTVTHKFAEDDERLIREYIEKVNGGFGANIGGDNGVNTKSIVASKNDMGGTTANIANGHREVSADIGAKSTVQGNGLTKPNAVPNPDAAGNINVPGGKAGKTAFKTSQPGHGAEKKGERPGKMSGAGTGEMGGQRGEQLTKSPLNARK